MKISGLMSSGATLIDNTFIDNYMADANGEFVKIYLYLVRCASAGREVSIPDIADFFEQTEGDVKRALNYWNQVHLIDLKQDSAGNITGICIVPSASAVSGTASPDAVPESAVPAEQASSRQRERQLQRTELSRLFYVAEIYFQRKLSSSEMSMLDYFTSDLGMSSDLVEYLLEYCIGKGHTSVRYMEKVAQAWVSKNITTVAQAKEEARSFGGDYTAIFRELGLSRQPAPAETRLMDKWLSEYAFSLDIIREACRRTVLQVSSPSLSYADGILTSWHKSGVRNMDQIRRLDEDHAADAREKENAKSQLKTGQARGQKSRLASAGKFNSYSHEDTDWNSISRAIMNQQKQEI